MTSDETCADENELEEDNGQGPECHRLDMVRGYTELTED